MPAFLAACGGFLLGVLWMDLLFDVQTLAGASEHAVASIAAYYHRVTTEAYPMNRLIAAVMLLTVAGALYLLISRRVTLRVGALALLCAGVAVGLALARVVPNAVRLGSRADALADQAALAVAICIDHLLCFGMMTVFVALVIAAARNPS